MGKERFVYVTYIRTTRSKLWHALTDPDFNRKYWFGAAQESVWKKGAPWRIVGPEGEIKDSGEVVEIDPERKIVLSWRNEFVPDLRAEGYSRATFEIEENDGTVKLTVTHEMETDKPGSGSKLIGAVSNGWPMILSGLKSLLETGESIANVKAWPKTK